MNTGKFSNDQTEGSERERLRADLQSLARRAGGAVGRPKAQNARSGMDRVAMPASGCGSGDRRLPVELFPGRRFDF